MRKFFLNLGWVVLALSSMSADAEVLGKEGIPAAIIDQLYKKHPNALDISAEQKKHFGVDLYEVFFKEKEGGDKQVELYRPDGRFYINGALTETSKTSNVMPSAGYDSLNAAFKDYEIKEMVLVTNPNGLGEEYDLTVNASGVDWSVSIDRNGNIYFKEQK